MRGEDITNARIFVAGYFPADGLISIKPEYTCRRCPPIFLKYPIKSISIPTISGWLEKTVEQAKSEAQQFADFGAVHETRKSLIRRRFTITNLKL